MQQQRQEINFFYMRNAFFRRILCKKS